MKYDVFISYSRKDSEIANRVCEAFDRVGISYFIDKQGIGGGFEFPVVIAEAILECSVVLFLASKNSYESKFTNAELTFAFNEKPKNSVLPYIIDGSTMPPAMRFVFSSINWRNIDTHPIEPILVDDILQLLGRDSNEKKSIVTLEEKVYKVGDLYDDGDMQGVVFEVWDGGKHGKIVSLKQAYLPWCTLDQYKNGIVVGANSRTDGKSNTNIVMKRDDCADYPIFKWCRENGSDWYLPSLEEMQSLFKCKDRVNTALRDNLYESLTGIWYWSSTEDDKASAYGVRMSGDARGNRKHYDYYVRAVATF